MRQSNYEVQLPIRSIILGPSGIGNTSLLQNIVVDTYKGFYEIYIFSPSIDVESSWRPVKKYIEKAMKVKQTDEAPIYFDHYMIRSTLQSLESDRDLRNKSREEIFELLRRRWEINNVSMCWAKMSMV